MAATQAQSKPSSPDGWRFEQLAAAKSSTKAEKKGMIGYRRKNGQFGGFVICL
jgi:hypothetical protein